MEIEKNIAKALHLTKYEAKVYVAGLKFDQATITELSKVAGVPRTAVYPPIQSLSERGLMSSIKIGKRIHYRALEASRLPYLLERERTYLDEVIGDLDQKIEVPAGDISVRYFPGLHGIEVAGDIFLNETKCTLWKTFENPFYVSAKAGEFGFDRYIERRVGKKIHSRTIIPANTDSSWIKTHQVNAVKELIEIITVSPREYPIEGSIGIADDMILMLAAKALPFAILIRNKELTRTLESMHDMIWDRFHR